jgi:diaminopimelate epimerase
MNTHDSIKYYKMNGLGNDFIIFDNRQVKIKITKKLIRIVANRELGIGCDQVILIDNYGKNSIYMRIWNQDGTEVSACGNATRCVASKVLEERSSNSLKIITKSGELICTKQSEKNIKVDMGIPKFKWEDIPISKKIDDTSAVTYDFKTDDLNMLYSPSLVNVGNPHCILWLENITSIDIRDIGSKIENDILFPKKVNVSFANIKNRKSIDLIVWERGVGITKACGTAACAVAVAASRINKAEREVEINLPGGSLDIIWDKDDHIQMIGEAVFDYEDYLPKDLIAL